jgi:hypothetical protein
VSSVRPRTRLSSEGAPPVAMRGVPVPGVGDRRHDSLQYEDAVQKRHGSQKVPSEHLYQIVSYLRNVPACGRTVEGILLYPAVKSSFDLRYTILDFPIRVVSIDMAQPWPSIRERLLSVLDSSGNQSLSGITPSRDLIRNAVSS